MSVRGRIAGPLFAALKSAWDTANLKARFPGGYVAGQRIQRPNKLPCLQPWPMKESLDTITNKGGYLEFQFEVGIVGESFEQCTDWKLGKALEDATIGLTSDGPVVLDGGSRLVAINTVPMGANYIEDKTNNLFICFVLFSAKVSQ